MHVGTLAALHGATKDDGAFTVGETGVRTVAHGFEPWDLRSREICESAERAKESFLSPVKTGSQKSTNLLTPT